MKKALLLLLSAGLWHATSQSATAQIVLDETTNTVTTNFNGWNGTLPAGFAVSGESTTYYGTEVTTTSGGLYAVPGMGFGYQPSTSADTLTLTATYQNGSDLPITSIEIKYEAFQIIHRDSRIPKWNVAVNGTNVPELTYTYVNTSAISYLSHTVTGLNIPPGATFTISFRGGRGGGTSSTPKYGLNNVEVKAYSAGIPLSISISDLGIDNRGQQNVLAWKTYKSEGTHQFQVQRSMDGYNFHTIATIEGKEVAANYEYVDAQPVTGTNYYRLAINSNDQWTYSNTVKTINQVAGTISIYPNPATNFIVIKSALPQSLEVNMYDVTGKRVKNAAFATAETMLDIAHLPAGQYIIKVTGSNVDQTFRIVK